MWLTHGLFSAGLASDAGRRFCRAQLDPAPAAFPAPEEALQLPVLPRTWEMPLLGQLNLVQLCCGCTLSGSQLSPDLSRGTPKEL